MRSGISRLTADGAVPLGCSPYIFYGEVMCLVKVEILLFATLRRYHPRGEGEGSQAFTLQLESNTNLSQIYAVLGIPGEEVKMNFVNNRHQSPDYQVQAGDKIALFPPIAGG